MSGGRASLLPPRPLQQLISRTVPKDELPSFIEAIFSDEKTTSMVDCLRKSDAQAFIDVIDGALDSLNLASHVQNKCVKLLYRMCAHHSLLPRSLQIELSYNPADVPHARGGSADVWKGQYHDLEVGVKVLKTYATSDLQKITHRFCKEFMTWKALRHPNVLPLIGVMMTGNRFAMVSEWMTNGNINEFVTAHRDVNRFELLCDVARGLIYMHDQGMVHGDLKGSNILIGRTCNALLADFGLLSIISDSTTSTFYTQGGTIRWMGPELLDPEIQYHRRTKYSDRYALGMVVYEVLSEQIPFHQYANPAIPGKIVRGDRPERPQGVKGVWFMDDIWRVLERCWTPQPGNRSNVENVLQSLERGSRSWTPSSPWLSAAPSRARGFMDMTTVEPTSGSGPSFTSQVAPSRWDLEESARIISRVPPNYRGGPNYLSSWDENPAPETEIVNQREGEVRVHNGHVSYLVSQPIPEGKILRRVVVTIVSKDQGHSKYPEDRGTYRGSWTWFELSVGSPSEGSEERWRGKVVRNLHGYGEFKEHTIEITDKKLYENAKSGDVLTIWAHARFPSWVNTVKKATIRYVVE